jgi:hypothetical protein
MKLIEYIENINKNTQKPLSKTKKDILQLLWSTSEDFPKEWIMSKDILEKTNQGEFARRIRELKEAGCDIESGIHESLPAYRLISEHLKIAKIREYLNPYEKTLISTKQSNCCAVCSINLTENNPQADHKIPLDRCGTNDKENWQILCRNCNIGKRAACAGCELDCLQCPWAFPENGKPTIVNMNIYILKKTEREAKKLKITKEQLIIKILEEWEPKTK